MAAPLLSQQSAPAASGQSQQPNSEQTSSNGPVVIKTKVRQVLFDVVVMGDGKQPVAGLHQQDFSVFEDGKLQKITSFEAHEGKASSPKMGGEELQLPQFLPNTFLNLPTANENLPLNVLLYDLLNTPLEAQPFAHGEIVKFLKNKPTGSRFAIFVLSDKLHLLQGFTDDENQLVAAMNTKNLPRLPLHQSQGAATEEQARFTDNGVPESISSYSVLQRSLEHMETIESTSVLQRRVEITLGAFADIARFLGGFRGRKNLIWLSGSFPSSIFMNSSSMDAFTTLANYNPLVAEATNLLTTSQVAVYPVNTLGLATDPMYDNSIAAGISAVSLMRLRSDFVGRISAEQTTMDQIAENSGGHAFYNTNGLNQAITAATNDGANYYTLSYSPTNTKFDGRLRKIRVVVGQKGYHLSYRRGYLADDPDRFAQQNSDVLSNRLERAMVRGTPFSHELILSVHVAADGPLALATPKQLEWASQFSALAEQKKRGTLQIQRYKVDFSLLGRQLALQVLPDGTRRENLEFAVDGYDGEGSKVVGWRTTLADVLPPDHLQKIKSEAYRAEQEIEVPAEASWLRFGVRDAVGDRIGSLEIALPLSPDTPAEATTKTE